MRPFTGAPSEWDQLICRLPDPHLLQTWEWSEIKSRYGWRARPVIWESSRGGDESAAAMVLERPAGVGRLSVGRTVLYCPKGPLLDWSDREKQARVLDDLEEAAMRERAVFLKLDPDVVIARGIPDRPDFEASSPGEVVRSQLRDRGWRYSAEQVQFKNTVLLELSGAEDALMDRMKSKARYNIGLAQRRGVRVRSGTPADLPMLYQMYAKTSLRDGFAIRDEGYYRTVWRAFMVEPSITHDRPWCEALVAEVEGEAVAALFVFMFAGKAYYLYGMSTQRHREKMPNHLLQWEAIRLARRRGCTVYDLWGAPDRFEPSDRMWGVFRFKEGLGGRVVLTTGAWDYVPSQLYYALYQTLAPAILSVLRPLAARRVRQGLGT